MLVYWISRKREPYGRWNNLRVTYGTLLDQCGCRRKRFREHIYQHNNRWGMYYEITPDLYESSASDPRGVEVSPAWAMLVIKMYWPEEGISQADMNHEFAWVIRPCEKHGPKLTALQKRAHGARPPAHWMKIK